MNENMLFPLGQVVTEAVLAVLLLQAKKRAAALPEPARSNQTFGLTAALVCTGIVILLSLFSLIRAIARA